MHELKLSEQDVTELKNFLEKYPSVIIVVKLSENSDKYIVRVVPSIETLKLPIEYKKYEV